MKPKTHVPVTSAAEGGGEFRGVAAGAVGADAHAEHGPAGECGHFARAATFEFKEREDEAFVGIELVEDALDKRGGRGFARIFFAAVEHWAGVEEESLLRFTEIGGTQLGAARFVAVAIATDIERDPRNPVLQRHSEIEAGEMIEDAGERFLHEVFGGVAPWQMGEGDGRHARMQAAHEFARGSLAAALQPGLGKFVVGA